MGAPPPASRPAHLWQPSQLAINVVLVEQDPVDRDLLAQQLHARGACVFNVESQQQAQELLARTKIDGAFLSWEVALGKDVADMVRKSSSSREAVITMLIGDSDTVTVAKAARDGVSFFLTKPLEADHLQNLLEAIHATMVQERRGYQRIYNVGQGTCRWGDHVVQGNIDNLSAGGVLLRMSPQPNLHDPVLATLRLNGRAQPFEANGRVVRVIADKVAIHFANLPPREAEELKHYVETARCTISVRTRHATSNPALSSRS